MYNHVIVKTDCETDGSFYSTSSGVVTVTVYKLHRYSAQFTTQRMPWAAISKGTMEHGFLPGECLTETL